MACLPWTFKNSTQCPDSEVVSSKARVWLMNHDDFVTGEQATVPTIVRADNLITTFTPSGVLYPLHMGEKFDQAVSSTAAVTPGGTRKFIHSAIAQVLDSAADTDAQVKSLLAGRFVIIVELKGSRVVNKPDAFKVYGCDSGLTTADGALVGTLSDNNGGVSATLASDAEDLDYESEYRWTVKTSTTYADELLALETAEAA